MLFLGRTVQSTCEEMCHTYKQHFTAFQPLALVCLFLYYRWNLCISFLLQKVKDAKPNPSSLIQNLINCMAVTEMRNDQIFQLKSLLSWLLFRCAYRLVHVSEPGDI